MIKRFMLERSRHGGSSQTSAPAGYEQQSHRDALQQSIRTSRTERLEHVLRDFFNNEEEAVVLECEKR